MKLTKILMDEHRVIEVALDCLEKIVAEANSDGKLNQRAAEQTIDVIRTFADTCHHGKEEDHLFAALVEKGLPQEGGPVGQMLHEHEEGRAFVRRMADSVAKAAGGDSAAIEVFSDSARGYVELLRAHILKEDNALFPMADDMLSEDDQQRLMQAFERVESDQMGAGTHEKYLGIVTALAKQYGVPAEHITAASGGCGH